MISWADVVNIASALSTVPEPAQAAILAQVEHELEPSQWGSKLPLGQKWLAAHIGTLYLRAVASGSSGAVISGPVISETVGSVSRTYASGGASSSSSSTTAAYDATPFGQTFNRLKLQLVARIGMAL